MSVLDRLNRLVRANLNHMASRASGRRVMGEVRDTLREARSQLVESKLADKRLSEKYQALLDESQSWEDRAVLALRARDEVLARRALERKQAIDQRAQAVKDDLDAHRSHMTDLMSSLDAIEVKLEAVRERGRTPRAGSESAGYERPAAAEPAGGAGSTGSVSPPSSEAPPRWARTEAGAELGTMGDDEAFERFDEMSDRLTRAEAELDAIRELNIGRGSDDWWAGPSGGPGGADDWRAHDPLADDLEARFRELETDRNLERLKRRTGPLDDLRRRLDEE